MDAWDDLVGSLEPGEAIEAVVFGWWRDEDPREYSLDEGPLTQAGFDAYYEEYAFRSPPVPFDKTGALLTPDEARPYMVGWRLLRNDGACHAIRAWTDRRVLWVTVYDGMTTIDSAPRNPTAHVPNIPGGG